MKAVERAVELYMKHLGRVNQKLNNLKGEAQKELTDKEKSNNYAPDLSDIDALVKMNPEKNVVRHLLELEFEFSKDMPRQANIRGIDFDTTKQVWKHPIVS